MAYVRSGSQQPTGNAVAGDVKSGKIFSNENDVDLVGTFAAQEKTVTAGTSAASVTPDSGKYLSKVTYNPTPSQTKSVNPSTSAQNVTPDSGKLLSKVTVNAISTQTKTVTASRSNQTVTPDGGKYLSRVTVNKYPDASGTYTPTGSDLNNAAADMTATNNLRFVNTAVCYHAGEQAGYTNGYSRGQANGYADGHSVGYNEGHSDGYNQGVVHEANNRSQYFSSVLREPNDQLRIDIYGIKGGTKIKLWTTNTVWVLCRIYDSNENIIRAQWNFSNEQSIDSYTFPSDGNYIIRLEKLDPYYYPQGDGTNFWAWYQLTNSNY